MWYPAGKSFKKFRYSLGSLLLAGTGGLQAAELYGPWYWHAFASQGLVHTSDNDFAGKSDDSLSTDLRELGLILGGEPVPGLHLAAQLLSRKAGEMDDGDVRLDYGFAGYMLYADWDRSVGIKAGRIRSPVGLYNETRDVAHTRSSILLPQSMYFDRLRNLSFARDGVHLYGDYQFGLNTLRWDLAYGQTLVSDEDLPEIVLGQELPGQVDTPFLPLGRVLWDWDAGRIRLGLTYHPLEYEYEAAANDYYNSGTIDYNHWIVSAEYNASNWSVIGEYTFGGSQVKAVFDQLSPDANLDSYLHAYYLQGIYRPGFTWDIFLRYDVQNIRMDELSMFDSTVRDVTVGVGWRPDERWLLRAEWHLVDGVSWLSVRENRVEDLQQHWQMVLFQISYRI